MISKSAQLRTQAKEVSNGLMEMGGTVKDLAPEQLEQTRDDAMRRYEQGRDKAHNAACSVENYVRERPVKSVLIAAGIGLLFGRFWTRR
ncbi:MAG: hypothetical protein WD468_10295 [Pirellulales bacterium]